MSSSKQIARKLGAALGQLQRKWESLDRYSHLFPKRDEFHQWYVQTRERNIEVKRAQMKAYARTNILPRVKFGTGFMPQLQLPEDAGGSSPSTQGAVENAGILLIPLLIAAFTYYLYYTGVGAQGVGLLEAMRMPALGMSGVSMAPPKVGGLADLTASSGSAGHTHLQATGEGRGQSVENVEDVKSRLTVLERRLADLTTALAAQAAAIPRAETVAHDRPVQPVDARTTDKSVADAAVDAGHAADGQSSTGTAPVNGAASAPAKTAEAANKDSR